jgi:hypothetical protein
VSPDTEDPESAKKLVSDPAAITAWTSLHCIDKIFYYKFLFQLFGEDDPDQNVSPDTEDPEAAGDQAGEVAAQREANGVSEKKLFRYMVLNS